MDRPGERDVVLPIEGVELEGTLSVPPRARGLVLFCHGSGSSRMSPRNRLVARRLVEAGCGTLLFDLLTAEEAEDRTNVFDIPLLARRLLAATDWAQRQLASLRLPVAYFGASTGAAAALIAAAERGGAIAAVVSRGGRPDLAMDRLDGVRAPTLLIVGSRDEEVLGLNRMAFRALTCQKRLAVVEGATHLFEQPGALEEVADLAAEWLVRVFADSAGAPPAPARGHRASGR